MQYSTFIFDSLSISDTLRFGRAFADALPEQAAVALHGTLGAGKTLLVQGMASELDIDPHTVTSPTFVICNEYIGRKTLIHADVYRLNDSDDFLAIGGDEWFQSQAITLIEWAEKIDDCLPLNLYSVSISQCSESARQIVLKSPCQEVTDAVSSTLKAS